MSKRDLIIHLPVIHKGYIDFFKKNQDLIDKIFVIDEELLSQVTTYKPDIASIPSSLAIKILSFLGFNNVFILGAGNISHPKSELILIQDEISRSLFEKYFHERNVEWQSVFLRWDRSSVLSAPSTEFSITEDPLHKKIMQQVYENAEKSGDWWRQVGAILVKNGKTLLASYNKGVPWEHTPYQVGDKRDFLNVGERPDLSSVIHAEQKIVADAAAQGISLKGATLYITHFPCSVCAKLIAFSGITECYFSEGSANIEGKASLDSTGVTVTKVKM